MRSRLGLLLVLAMLVLAGAGVWLWLQNYEWVEEPQVAAPRGIARYNPLYGLQRTLETLGHEVVARPLLALPAMDLQPGELLVLGSDIRALGNADVNALLDWVEDGGRLLFALPASESSRLPALLSDLQLDLVADAGCTDTLVPTICADYRLRPTDEFLDTLDGFGDDEAGYVFGHAGYGEGRWAFAGRFDFLRGRALRSKAHAGLAWQVVGPLLTPAPKRIHLVYAVDMPPLHVVVLRDGWPLLLPLFAALLAWLWARAQRIGPLLPLPSPHRRALSEHVQAAAHFVLRSGRGDALLAPVQRRVQRRLEQHHPDIAALAVPEQVVALSRMAGLDEAAVRDALLPSRHERAESFRAAVQTLLQIEATL